MESKHERKSDEMIQKVLEKFEKFEDFQKATYAWRAAYDEKNTQYDEKLNKIKSMLDTVMIPYKIASWIVIICGASFLKDVGHKISDWAIRHIK